MLGPWIGHRGLLVWPVRGSQLRTSDCPRIDDVFTLFSFSQLSQQLETPTLIYKHTHRWAWVRHIHYWANPQCNYRYIHYYGEWLISIIFVDGYCIVISLKWIKARTFFCRRNYCEYCWDGRNIMFILSMHTVALLIYSCFENKVFLTPE